MQSWRCVQEPGSEAKALPIVGTHQDDVCRLDEQSPEILAPALGDATENGSATRAVLARHKAKPRAKVTTALECVAGADGRHHGRRDQRADAGNAHEATAVGFLLADRLNLAGNSLDPLIEAYPVFVETNNQAAHSWRYLVLPVL